MDLINATGESVAWKYDGQRYEFPPNEVVSVPDLAGQHLLNKLSWMGLQKISYGDDPSEISVIALRAIVAFHQRQVKAHDAQVRVATETRNPVPSEPDGYKAAVVALKSYAPLLEAAEKDNLEFIATQSAAKIKSAVKEGPQMPELEDMDQAGLRAVVESLGAKVNNRHGPAKLIKQIRELQAEKDMDA